MIKPILWHTLFTVAKIGGLNKPTKLSTKDLAPNLGLSQQTISRHLIKLDKLGYIQRQVSYQGIEITISPKGIEELRNIYLNLKSIIDEPRAAIILNGIVTTGLGEGAYYISKKGYKDQFLKKLGFNPYPGTLNVRLSTQLDIRKKEELNIYTPVIIEGFKEKDRSFGPVLCYPAIINNNVEGAITIIERTHHRESFLEIVAPVNIRKKLVLKDGDEVQIRVLIK
jgi:riboflavin kinase